MRCPSPTPDHAKALLIERGTLSWVSRSRSTTSPEASERASSGRCVVDDPGRRDLRDARRLGHRQVGVPEGVDRSDQARGGLDRDRGDIASCSEKELYEVRKLFGVLFQDGAMFGSMNLYDNVAFLSREHTKKSETEIRDVVMEKLDLVGLLGTEDKLPGAYGVPQSADRRPQRAD